MEMLQPLGGLPAYCTANDIIFLAGGWGAAYDFGFSDVCRKISEAWRAGKVISEVCHGPLGLLRALDEDGRPLVEGRRLTAVTDKQIRELGIETTLQHPERELRSSGARFESETAFRDFFPSRVVVDGRLVTGQNQNTANNHATGDDMRYGRQTLIQHEVYDACLRMPSRNIINLASYGNNTDIP